MTRRRAKPDRRALVPEHAPPPRSGASGGSVPLATLRPGDAGRVIDVTGEGAFRRRLLDMGFVNGTFVRVIKHAPLMNPIEYCIGGAHVTLRRDEAMHVVVAPVPTPEHCRRHMHGRRGTGLRHGRGKGRRWWRMGR